MNGSRPYECLNINSVKKLKSNAYACKLKVLSGESAIDALKISEDSIFVLQESIRILIDKNEIKKAANLIQKKLDAISVY